MYRYNMNTRICGSLPLQSVRQVLHAVLLPLQFCLCLLACARSLVFSKGSHFLTGEMSPDRERSGGREREIERFSVCHNTMTR